MRTAHKKGAVHAPTPDLKRIAYLGRPGSFSHEAFAFFASPKTEEFPLPEFSALIQALLKKRVDGAILPLENSLIGALTQSYDLLQTYPVQIIQELYLPITLALLGKGPKKGMKKITRVLSHPAALSQCERFLNRHPQWERVAVGDTASAAAGVEEEKEEGSAAISGYQSAELYHLEIWEKEIQDNPNNFTRFVLITRKEKGLPRGQKVSCTIILPHAVGTLSHLLWRLASLGINLTQILSRPIKSDPFAYRFFLDLLLSEERQLEELTRILAEAGQEYRILGCYPEGEWKIG